MLNATTAAAALGFTAKQTFGLRWEQWAATELTRLGYQVTTPPDFNAAYDLRIGRAGHAPLLHVEVKAARLSRRKVRPGYYRPRYQWDLTGGMNRDKIDYLYILIAISETTGEITPFIVPSYALGHRRHVQITSEPHQYRGKLLSEYRHNWAVIDQVYDIRQRFYFTQAGQLPLFDFGAAVTAVTNEVIQ